MCVCVCVGGGGGGGGGANWGCTKWQCTLMRASAVLRVGVACALSIFACQVGSHECSVRFVYFPVRVSYMHLCNVCFFAHDAG